MQVKKSMPLRTKKRANIISEERMTNNGAASVEDKRFGAVVVIILLSLSLSAMLSIATDLYVKAISMALFSLLFILFVLVVG